MVARPFKAGFGTPGFQRQQSIVSRSDNLCANIGYPPGYYSSIAPRRGGCLLHRFRGLKPPATIESRSARNADAICRRAAFDGSPAFQGRDRMP
jgi:hypothetical protein